MRVDLFPIFRDLDGALLPIDFFKIPFEPKRVFIVSDVPKGEERGFHAHKECKQFLICVKGEIGVNLIDAVKNVELKVTLSPGQSVFVNNLIWDSQVFKTGNDILMVLASEFYDADDYIHTMDEYKNFVKGMDVSEMMFI